MEKMHQGIEMEKVLSVEKLRQETEQAKIELQRQKLTLVGEGKVTADVLLTDNSSVPGNSPKSDDLSELRLVPRFDERDPETFLSLFEPLTEARGWSDSSSTLMMCVNQQDSGGLFSFE